MEPKVHSHCWRGWYSSWYLSFSGVLKEIVESLETRIARISSLVRKGYVGVGMLEFAWSIDRTNKAIVGHDD